MDTKKLPIISLNEIRKKRRNRNYTEEKLASKQRLSKVDIPEPARVLIEEALEVLTQLTAYYVKGIPFDKTLSKDFVQSYIVHSDCTKEKQLVGMIIDVAKKRIKADKLPKEKYFFDSLKMGTFANIIMTQKLRNSTTN